MTDPVVAEDGQTYQRQAIEEWINKCIAGMATKHGGGINRRKEAALKMLDEWGGSITRDESDVLPSPYTYVLHRLMAGGRPVTSPLTGVEMGSYLVPNALVRSLVRGWHRR
jgi:hypothetical protein